MRRSAAVLLCAMGLSGCYTFQPVTVADLQPGSTIRARVTGAFSDSLATTLQRDARVFEGDFVQTQAGRVMLQVPVSSGFRGMRMETLSQRVEIPTDAFVEIEQKNLSKNRTFLAVGVAAAAAVTLVVTQFNSNTGGGALPGQGGPVEAVVGPSLSLGNAWSWLWSR